MVGRCMASRAGALLKEQMIILGKCQQCPVVVIINFSTVTYMLFLNSHSLIMLFRFKSLCLERLTSFCLSVCMSQHMLVLHCLLSTISCYTLLWFSTLWFYNTFRCILPIKATALRANLKILPHTGLPFNGWL